MELVGLECKLCSQCMCRILAFTRGGTLPVHPFTPSFSPKGRKKLLSRACFRGSVNVRLFKTLGFVLRFAVARHFTLSRLQETKEEVRDTHDALIA